MATTLRHSIVGLGMENKFIINSSRRRRTMTQRSFSLWPTTFSPPTPTSSSSSLKKSDTLLEESTTPLTPPRPPTMAELSLPSSLPDPSFWEPLSNLLITLPSIFEIPWPFFIPLLTLFIRGTTTIPLQLWQRKQTRKFTTEIQPFLELEQKKLVYQVRDQCRREGKSYEQYKKAYTEACKEEAKKLYRTHKFYPRLTLYLPPALNVPILVTMSLILRDACNRALTSLPLSTSTLNEHYPDSSLLLNNNNSALLLIHLQDLATSSWLWCPSLCLPDSTMFVPLLVGLLTLLNTEVSSLVRKATVRATVLRKKIEEGGKGTEKKMLLNGPADSKIASQMGLGKGMTASEKRRLTVLNSRGRRGDFRSITSTTTTSNHFDSKPRVEREQEGKEEREVDLIEEDEEEPRRNRIMTNAMRVAAVVFIPIASLAPVGVCLYWISSNCLTLLTNLTFAWLDRRKEKNERLRKILIK